MLSTIYRSLLLVVVLITLSSCRSNPPAIKDSERCVTVMEVVSVNEAGEELITGHCRCGAYRFSIDGIGWIDPDKNYNKPLSYCNKMVGWTPDQWKNLYTDFENLRLWLVQQQNAQ